MSRGCFKEDDEVDDDDEDGGIVCFVFPLIFLVSAAEHFLLDFLGVGAT